MTVKLTATAPDGTVFTRRTDRRYKFVVTCRRTPEQVAIVSQWSPKAQERGTGYLKPTWSSRRDLADRQASKLRLDPRFYDVIVAPVNE